MNNSDKIYEKIKKYTMIYRARQMEFNISNNPDEEVLALYDREKGEIDKGSMLAIIVDNRKENYLMFYDKDDNFSKNKAITVEGIEYGRLKGMLRVTRDKLEKYAHSEVKIVESTYGRKLKETSRPKEIEDEEKGIYGKVKGAINKGIEAILDRMKLNDYDEEYEDDYEDDYEELEYEQDDENDYYEDESFFEIIGDLGNRAKEMAIKVKDKIQENRKREQNKNVINLGEYRKNRNKPDNRGR